MRTTTHTRTLPLTAALLFIASAPVHASFISGNINSGARGVVCGSASPIDPAEPCFGSANLASVSLEDQFSDANGSYEARTFTGYGVNKVYSASNAVSSGVSSSSEWMVVYTLTGAPIGTPVNLVVELGYEVSISSTGLSEAGFRMVLNNDFFGPFDLYTTTHPFGGDHCFDRPGQTVIGACAGYRRGTVSRAITASVGPNNRLALLVSASAFGAGLVDAYHTVEVLKVTVPDNIGWQYQGLSGNPLNFQYNSPASAVPEPSALHLLSAGSLCIAVRAGFRRRLRG